MKMGLGELSICFILGDFFSIHFVRPFVRSFVVRSFILAVFFINQTTKRCFCLTKCCFFVWNWARHRHSLTSCSYGKKMYVWYWKNWTVYMSNKSILIPCKSSIDDWLTDWDRQINNNNSFKFTRHREREEEEINNSKSIQTACCVSDCVVYA